MKNKTFSNRRLMHAALFASLLGAAPAAHAADFIWDGSLTINAWDDAVTVNNPNPFTFTNWTFAADVFPDADDTVTFPGTADRFVVDLNGDREVLSATFDGANDYTLNNDTLTLLTGDLTATGTATHTINSNLTLGAGGTFDIGPDAAIIQSGVLTSTSNLTQRGAGTLTLIAQGSSLRTLRIGTSGNGAAASDFVIDGGSLDISTREIRLADDGRGTLTIQNGGSLISGNGDIGTEVASDSASVLVTGTDALGNASSWTSSGEIRVGNFFSASTMVVSAGGQVSSQRGVIEDGPVTVTGTDADGNPSTWDNASDLDIGDNGGSLLVEAGGRVTAGSSRIGISSNNSGSVVVQGSSAAGNASSFVVDGTLRIADRSSTDASLDILDGGYVSSGNATVGFDDFNAEGDVLVRGVDGFGNQATWAIDGSLELGTTASEAEFDGEGTLEIGTGGVVTVTGTTTVNRGGDVRLRGGAFSFGQTTLADYQRFDANSGVLAGTVTGVELTGLNDAADLGLDALLPSQPGAVDTSGVVIGSVINNGRVFGNGTIDIDFTNGPSGEIEVINGERMLFTGPANDNLGQVTLAGGQVEFTQGFTNAAGGLVVGNGSLRADAGIVNDGTMAFSATANVLGDVTNNAGGLITSSGGTTTFFDDVVNNGEVRTNQDSFTVYFGSVSGNGDTGSGTVIIEGDLKPGFSPGITAYAGNLQFGDNASMLIEFAGLTPGTEHDMVTVANDLTLDGQLDVALLDGFTPDLNQVFDIITIGGELTGTFDGLNEDALVGNFGGTDLFITYQAGDGNDVALYAVPEPTSLALLGLGGLLVTRRRR